MHILNRFSTLWIFKLSSIGFVLLLMLLCSCSNNDSNGQQYPDTSNGVVQAMNDTAKKTIEYEQAQRRNRAINSNPDYALMAKAQQDALNLDYVLALEEYNKVLARNPSESEAYLGRGYVYQKLKEYDKALSDYDRAINLDPEFPQAYVNRAAVYAAIMAVPRCLADLQKACSLGDDRACRMLQDLQHN